MRVEGCRLKNVTFILGEMRERERGGGWGGSGVGGAGLGSSGGWVAGRGLGTTV